jgi:hypothetical protein
MSRSSFRGTAAVALATAAVGGALAVAPAASAAPSGRPGGALQCRTQIDSSATSGKATTSTSCTKAGSRSEALSAAASRTLTSVRPGSTQAKSVVPAKAVRSSADLRGWVSTGVHFRNSTSDTVSVTIMYYDPSGCAGYGDWGTQGWWNIAPGQEINVKNTSNRYVAFHAYSSRLNWSGPYNAYVKSWAFQSCVGIGSTDSRIVGERLVDLGDVTALPYTTHTVNLVG